ncbi:MAG TPA: FAD-dependent oxidoreductase, partial [Rhabdochlamydiaceae bacterium]|nr:FAD-dependent oxidoreductase [Rhabdochlamydiaceae bacterium]
QIFSSIEAEKRYLCLNNKLHKFPRPLFSFSFLKEWFVPSKAHEEETIYDFAVRRFNKKIADRFFDPLAIGVYAGDARTLSINSCFPYFKTMEEKYGSVTRGFLKTKIKDRSLFSFTGGMQTLTDALHDKLKDHLHFNEEVTKVHFSKQGVEVITSSGVLEADILISALPIPALGKIFQNQEISKLLHSIKSQGLLSIHLGFKEEVLPFKAFG